MRSLKHLWTLMMYRPWLFLIDELAWGLASISYSLPALVVREYFDVLSGKPTWSVSIWQVVAAIGLVGVITGTLKFIGIVDIRFRSVLSTLLRRNMLARILERPGSLQYKESTGELLSRFRDDVNQVETAVLRTPDATGAVLGTIVTVAILLAVNWTIALLIIPPLVCVVLMTRTASTRIYRYREASRESTEKVTGFIGEMFGVVQAVKLARVGGRLTDRLRTLNAHRRKLALKDRLITEIVETLSANVTDIATGCMIMVGAAAFGRGTLTVGDFALFVQYFALLSWRTQLLGGASAIYTQTAVSFQRMASFMPGGNVSLLVSHEPIFDGRPHPDAPQRPAVEPLETLEVRDLAYSYDSDGTGVADVSLRMERGSLTVVTGRVGSGKSTVLKAILGLLPLERGTVLWNGRALSDLAAEMVPPRCAYTPQVPALLSASVRENILLGMPDDPARVAEAINLAVFEDDLATMAQGLETLVGPSGVRLSGGQQQRLSAARMFVRRPELLVFDDLSSALDVNTEREMWRRVFARGHATCLVVSHRRAVLERADNIVVMKDGRVLDQGRLDELLTRCEEMRELVQEQAQIAI